MMWLNDTNNNWNILNTYASSIFSEKMNLEDIKYEEMMKTQYNEAFNEIKQKVDVFRMVDKVADKNEI